MTRDLILTQCPSGKCEKSSCVPVSEPVSAVGWDLLVYDPGSSLPKYHESPGRLDALNAANLVEDAAGGVEMNTACIQVSGTLPNVVGSYLHKNDMLYFGWDENGESTTVEDTCCWLIYGNTHCEIDPQKTDYDSICGTVWQTPLPFDLGSFQVTNCVAMFKPRSG